VRRRLERKRAVGPASKRHVLVPAMLVALVFVGAAVKK
jgi:hypothetical protein